jgi:hypothetical protein
MLNVSSLIQSAYIRWCNGYVAPRKPGYHASSTNHCPRKVIFQRYAGNIHEPPAQTRGIFNVGHIVDQIYKDSVDAECRDRNLFPLAPFETNTYIGDLHIIGEGDITILDFDDRVIHIVDTKSKNDDGWWMAKNQFDKPRKNYPKVNHMYQGQVGTYMLSAEVQMIAAALKWDRIKGWILYARKDSLLPKVVPCQGAEAIATEYWTMMSELDKAFREDWKLPVVNDLVGPMESWECRYNCPLWPAMQEQDFPNKTAERKARSAHGAVTRNMCANGEEFLKVKISEVSNNGKLQTS